MIKKHISLSLKTKMLKAGLSIRRAASRRLGIDIVPEGHGENWTTLPKSGCLEWQTACICSWIQESTTEHSRWNEYSYGYLWWILRQNDSGTFAALGDSGIQSM